MPSSPMRVLRRSPGRCGIAGAAIVLALALTATPARPAEEVTWPPITEPPTFTEVLGKWVWAELFTENVQAAVRFYGEAFGWSFRAFPVVRGEGYTLALADGEPVGGMLQRGQTHREVRGSRWLGMISVADVGAAARHAEEHGGRVVVAPRMLAGRGEVALLTDPEGAPFGVIRSGAGDPPDYLADDRQWLWIELWARDPAAMARFYAGLAGYEITAEERPDGRVHYLLAAGGYSRCGVIASPAPTLDPAWLPYLRVTDVSAATTRAERAGARVVVAPNRTIRHGRVALLVDPAGAPLGLAQLEDPAGDAAP